MKVSRPWEIVEPKRLKLEKIGRLWFARLLYCNKFWLTFDFFYFELWCFRTAVRRKTEWAGWSLFRSLPPNDAWNFEIFFLEKNRSCWPSSAFSCLYPMYDVWVINSWLCLIQLFNADTLENGHSSISMFFVTYEIGKL